MAYELVKLLGTGSFGQVFLVRKLDEENNFMGFFASKKIKKDFTSTEEAQELEIMKEVEIQKILT